MTDARTWPHLTPAKEAHLLRMHEARRGKPVPPAMMEQAAEANRAAGRQRRARDAVFALVDLPPAAWAEFAARSPALVGQLRALVGSGG